jgi:hypothetical protein
MKHVEQDFMKQKVNEKAEEIDVKAEESLTLRKVTCAYTKTEDYGIL